MKIMRKNIWGIFLSVKMLLILQLVPKICFAYWNYSFMAMNFCHRPRISGCSWFNVPSKIWNKELKSHETGNLVSLASVVVVGIGKVVNSSCFNGFRKVLVTSAKVFCRKCLRQASMWRKTLLGKGHWKQWRMWKKNMNISSTLIRTRLYAHQRVRNFGFSDIFGVCPKWWMIS